MLVFRIALIMKNQSNILDIQPETVILTKI